MVNINSCYLMLISSASQLLREIPVFIIESMEKMDGTTSGYDTLRMLLPIDVRGVTDLESMLSATSHPDIRYLSLSTLIDWMKHCISTDDINKNLMGENLIKYLSNYADDNDRSSLFDEFSKVKENPLTLNNKLTPKERLVLQDLAQGYTLSEIAIRRNRSIKTISSQKRNAIKRLGLANDMELYMWLAARK